MPIEAETIEAPRSVGKSPRPTFVALRLRAATAQRVNTGARTADQRQGCRGPRCQGQQRQATCARTVLHGKNTEAAPKEGPTGAPDPRKGARIQSTAGPREATPLILASAQLLTEPRSRPVEQKVVMRGRASFARCEARQADQVTDSLRYAIARLQMILRMHDP